MWGSAEEKSSPKLLCLELSLGFFTSLFVAALELVLARCLDDRWLRLLREQGAWASLAEPRAHSTGVCLLAR